MSGEERRRDRELAAFTDALLEGRLKEEDSRPPTADTIAALR